MRVWVVKTSEMLASDNAGGRLLRSGLVAHMLDARGHQVTWWVSTFDHANRRQRSAASVTSRFGANGRLRMLRSPGYSAVISARRMLDHWIWGLAFAREIRREERPDVIFCAYPTIESAAVAARYGRRHRVPVVLDLRDMWPDIFVLAGPRFARPVLRLILEPLFALGRYACARATALFGITPEFVDWGLRYARRPVNEWDCAFPLAYPRSYETDSAVADESTRAFWDGLGVRREEAFNVVMVGSLNGKRYDMSTIFAAARELRGDSPAVRFVICGDGENLAAYRQQASDCPNVIFTGWLGAGQIREALARAHLGVVPYHNTPDFMMSVPNKAVEYLAAAVPVCTSLRGTLPRVLRENDCGLEYDVGDASGLASRIRALRDDSARHARLARNARELYERDFVAEEVYGRLMDRLERIARAPQGDAHAGRSHRLSSSDIP